MLVPTVYVECCIKKNTLNKKILANEIEHHVRKNNAGFYIYVGEECLLPPSSQYAGDIEFIRISDCDIDNKEKGIFLESCRIRVDIYRLSEVEVDLRNHLLEESVDLFGRDISESSVSFHGPSQNEHEETQEEPAPQAKVMSLPNRSLVNTWKDLFFEDNMQHSLLKFILNRIEISAQRLQEGSESRWSRVILLYGPPGTGKSSLCCAISQQMSIRLCFSFPMVRLVKVDAQSLFSKYFSESGKLVTKLFASIESILNKGNQSFVCILIDEIDSLAGCRKQKSGPEEPKDALRAVNALLVCIDRFRSRPNVVILCTSNLLDSLDSAFLDRISRKQYIGLPCKRARYEILRSELLSLAKCGLIVDTCKNDSSGDNGNDSDVSSSTMLDDRHQYQALDPETLPEYWELLFEPEASPALILKELSEHCDSLSGRALSELPEDSLCLYSAERPCSIQDALKALSRGIEEAFKVPGMKKSKADGS